MQTWTNTAKNSHEVSSNSLSVPKPVALSTLEHPQPCSERVCESRGSGSLWWSTQSSSPFSCDSPRQGHCWDLLLWQLQIIWFWLIRSVCARVFVCTYILVAWMSRGGTHTSVHGESDACLLGIWNHTPHSSPTEPSINISTPAK